MALSEDDIERLRGTALVNALRGDVVQLLNTPADILELIEVIDELQMKGNKTWVEPTPQMPTEYGQGAGCLHDTCDHSRDPICFLSCPCPKCTPQC